MVYLSGTGLPRLSWKKAVKRLCVYVYCLLVLVAVDFVELLNQASEDLSIAHGLNLTELYSVATQDQDVFLEECVLGCILLNRFHSLRELCNAGNSYNLSSAG